MEISHQTELTELRAKHAQELNELKSKLAKSNESSATSESVAQANGAAPVTSPNTPSSVNQMTYTKKKRYYQDKAAECEANGGFEPDPDDPTKCIRCGQKHNPDAHVGAPFGHEGQTVSRKPDERIQRRVKKCKCGRKKLRKTGTKTKLCIDFEGDTRKLKVTQFLLEEKYCSRCDLVITSPDSCIPGTSIGKDLAVFIVASAGDSDRYSRIVDNVRAILRRQSFVKTLLDAACRL